jgi:diguanylate cyclase (GGDEF)-like protein
MSSPTHTQALDFDAAKLQRLGFQNRPNVALSPMTLPQLAQQLGLQLQTSLEADRILEIFFQGVQQLLPLSGLVYWHVESDLLLRMGQSALERTSFQLRHEGASIGELQFERDEPFDALELGKLETLLACLLYPLRNALLYRVATQSALRDPLTGTGNRIAMDQSLAREIAVTRRNKAPLSVLMVDVDHFKHVNDEYGHYTGDEVLRAIAQGLKSQLRNIDRVFRYGGEEFVVLLTDTDRETAVQIGERLRSTVLGLAFPHHAPSLTMSISLGCSTLMAGETADSLVQRADSALYVAKREGRNRLVLACEP